MVDVSINGFWVLGGLLTDGGGLLASLFGRVTRLLGRVLKVLVSSSILVGEVKGLSMVQSTSFGEGLLDGVEFG
jgi:hypothetical protein